MPRREIHARARREIESCNELRSHKITCLLIQRNISARTPPLSVLVSEMMDFTPTAPLAPPELVLALPFEHVYHENRHRKLLARAGFK